MSLIFFLNCLFEEQATLFFGVFLWDAVFSQTEATLTLFNGNGHLVLWVELVLWVVNLRIVD